MDKAKNILSLNANEAFDFFMKAERYYTFELPEYFDFQPVLDFVKERVGSADYDASIASDPCDTAGVNLYILLNKDGKYAIRPLAIVNPYLYYFLVRDITLEHNWSIIQSCFNKFNNPHISACAIPVIPAEKESFHSSTTILNWWNSMEQRSVELSLEYRYMFVSDITNCYGSINPLDIDRALTMKGTKSASSERHGLAAQIVGYLQAFQGGRNVGIPQGSEIFNLLAEIILGYADLLLAEEIDKDAEITHSYEVLRYRDDYRIFSDDKDELERISYILQRILRDLNFQMNSKKTMVSDSIITDSIKQDKQFYIFNTPIYKRRRIFKIEKDMDGNDNIVSSIEKDCDFNGLQKNLLFILLFGRKYPNSGQIRTQLNEFDARLTKIIDTNKDTQSTFVWEDVDLGDNYVTKSGDLKNNANYESDGNVFGNLKTRHYRPIRESIRPMAAIATQIAIENITAAHYALRVISRLVNTFEDDDSEKKDIICKVCSKLRNQHNTTYLEVWLQNMTYNSDKLKDEFHYSQPLCRLVMGENVQLWNNSWLNSELSDDLPLVEICNKEKLDSLAPVITFRETRAYYDSFPTEL